MTHNRSSVTPASFQKPGSRTASGEALCLLNEQSRVVYASPRASLLLGWSGDQMLGLHVGDLLPPQEIVLGNGPPHVLLQALHSAAPLYGQRGHLLHRDGIRLLVEFNCVPMHVAGRWSGSIITFWPAHSYAEGALAQELAPDEQQMFTLVGRLTGELVSQQAEAQQLRQALAGETQRLQEAQEALRSRDAFLAIAAYELQTPVTLMLGYAQLLERRLTRLQASSNTRPLRVIVEQSQYLNEMMSSLFDIAHMQAGDMVMTYGTLDLAALVRGIQHELSWLPPHHQVQISAPDRVLPILGDRLRLTQVLCKLLQNAFKHSQEDSVVEVRLSVENTMAVIAVSDQRTGIDPSAPTELFALFYGTRGPRPRQASGLGIELSLVKEIVLLHEGHVDIERTDGYSSIFKVYLPLEGSSVPLSEPVLR